METTTFKMEQWFNQDLQKPLNFSLWKIEDVEHDFPLLISEAQAKLDHILNQTMSDSILNFETIEAIITCSEKIDFVWNVFQSLLQADASDKSEAISPKIMELITEFSSSMMLNDKLFILIEKIYIHFQNFPKEINLEQKAILKKLYNDFLRNGAKLNSSQKNDLKEIDQKLQQAQLLFSQNLRNYGMAVKIPAKKEDLIGLPDLVLEQFANKAKELKSTEADYIIGLDMPSVMAILTSAKNRKLREKIFKAFNSRCLTGAHSNVDLIKEILSLRLKRSTILNYQHHAHFVLEDRMAKDVKTVESFLNNLLEKSLPKAKSDIAILSKYALEKDGIKDFQAYDTTYYAELYRQEFFQVDDEKIREYFPLQKVLAGIFEICHKLYDLKFQLVENTSKYHQDVLTYSVHHQSSYQGLLYIDLYPRPSKQNGAWMSAFLEQGKIFNKVERPFIMIVGNFRKPAKGQETYLSLSEVETLFHEFGHALHGLLSQCQYRMLSGTNVSWDFVELPSQIFENWIFEEKVLPLITSHAQTKEVMPVSLLNKIKKSQNFLKSVQITRQIRFALLDLKLHTLKDLNFLEKEFNIALMEESILSSSHYLPPVEGTLIAPSFSHIFDGGYAAGYYSYHWAEVLDADAFSYFQENGILSKESGQKFKEFILSQGGTEDPLVLFEKFRGRKPNNEAFLQRSGLN